METLVTKISAHRVEKLVAAFTILRLVPGKGVTRYLIDTMAGELERAVLADDIGGVVQIKRVLRQMREESVDPVMQHALFGVLTLMLP